jgi:hypothetical protein
MEEMSILINEYVEISLLEENKIVGFNICTYTVSRWTL